MILKNVKHKGAYCTLVLEDGKIKHILSPAEDVAGETVDGKGCIVIPGLIDVHTHGREGMDTMDGDFAPLCDAYAKVGTTSVLLTTMTLGVGDLLRVCHAEHPERGAHILGIHLEGPYISKDKLGAQNPAFVRVPDVCEFEEFGDCVKMITVAPEVPGMLEFIRVASEKTVVSIGHTVADYDETVTVIEAGAKCLTHTFNAMPPFLHRAPGPIGAACEKHIYAQVIGDGFHVQRGALVSAYHMFSPERMVLISDSIAPAGLADGEYMSGGLAVEVRQGNIFLSGTDTIAGSSSTLLDCVRTVTSYGIPFDDAVRMATLTPAEMLFIDDRKGKIAVGYDADLLLLDEELCLKAVIIDGEFYTNSL